jgi:hypothetical protein
VPDVAIPDPADLAIVTGGQDPSGLIALFEQVFGHATTPAQWGWKYGGPPGAMALHRVAVATGLGGSAGQPWGHAGALVLSGLWGDRVVRVAHLMDVMVHPAVRGGMERGTVYARLMNSLAADLVAVDPQILAYGFPGRVPSRLGTRMGLYRELGAAIEHNAAAGVPLRQDWACQVSEVAWGHPSTKGWLQRCWDRLGGHQMQPCVRRDSDYVIWRYGHHPENPYRLWRVSTWGWRDRGWLITRSEPRATIVDALMPADARDPTDWGRVVVALARASGHRTWLTWRLPAHPQLNVSSNPGLIVPGEFLASELADGPPSKWSLVSALDSTASAGFQPGDTDVY